MKYQKITAPFKSGTKIINETDADVKYQIECDTANAVMHNYHLFPGIDLSYTTFSANYCFQRNASMHNVIEIAYCSAGRYECEYKRGYMTYLGECDFAVSVLDSQREMPYFPTSYYDGLAIIVDTDLAGMNYESGIEGISIDFKDLVQKYCVNHCCTVMKATTILRHVFNEMLEMREKINIGYLRLKVLEVFYHISNTLPNQSTEISAYYSGDTIKKIKLIKDDLMENYNKKCSLQDYAEKYDLRMTTMKECFKAVYGKPIYSFQREYKMQIAAKLLATTSSSITEVAGKIGYENPNKFSTAFKEVIGTTPREYRKKNN